jgi:dihydropyrimidinase
MYDLVIKDGVIVTEGFRLEADLAVAGETVAAVGKGLRGKREISAEGQYVLPGGIDIHTHMALPVAGTRSSDDFFTGTTAAACGGITSIVDFTAGSPETSLVDDLETRLETAFPAVIDYSFHCEIVGWNEKRREEMAAVFEKGLGTFKFFTAYGDSGRRTRNGALLEAFREISLLGGKALVHAEDDDIIHRLTEELSEEQMSDMRSLAYTRPDDCEALAVSTASWIARRTRARVHVVHLSSGLGLEEILLQKRLGTPLSCETCPQYLLLTDEVYGTPEGHLFSASPSLKKKTDNRRLWRGLTEGDIDFVATDHCPFTREQKTWKGSFRALPYGIPGVETSRTLIFSEGVKTDVLTMEDFARVTASAPARFMGWYPRKGTLLPGSDADIVLFDPGVEWEITARDLHMAVDFSPYESMRVAGKTTCTISRGQIIVQDGEFVGRQGRGRFVGFSSNRW